jgi:hypothetical protein
MEAEFLNLGLDIIGLGVFNYEFGSITTESPVIKAVYGVLKGEEHNIAAHVTVSGGLRHAHHLRACCIITELPVIKAVYGVLKGEA